jgi:hypothetical protein
VSSERRPPRGDPGRPSNLQPLDDAAIEQLVRDAASGWTMPAVRLDAPSWRDRVRSPGARRMDAARGWLVRAGQAATGAIALTVVGALLAVLLVRPPAEPGSSPDPTDRGPGPGPSGPAFTPFDKLTIKGEVPTPATVLVELEQGNFALVDLGTGDRHPVPTGAAEGSVVQWRSDGILLCLCVKTGAMANTQPTEAEITIDRFEADGTPISSFPAAHLVGAPDPRDGTVAERPPHVTFNLQVSEGGRFGIIGWSVREDLSWKSGITIVDLADGREVSRIILPGSTAGEGDTRRVAWAPRLLSQGDGSVVIAREWYSWSPPASEGGNYQQGTETFRADFAGGILSNPTALPGSDGCGERVIRAGVIRAGGSWIVCARGFTNTLVVRRFDAAGAQSGDTPLAGPAGVEGDVLALGPDGDTLFAWNPVTAQLASIDLATGELRESAAMATSGRGTPLAAIGSWLAPVAAAKTYLQSGVVVSPDGTRVYAAGVVGGADINAMAGSSGIFVFDASSLMSLGQWAPTADFISLAVSANGRYVYAAGAARLDASGQVRATQQASITVFKAADGAVELIAGELGFDFLTFATPILD